MTRPLLIIFTLLTIQSCVQPITFTDNEKAIVIEDVRMTLADYYADIRKSGLMAEFNYLDSSSDFFWVPPGYTTPLSYDSVAAVLIQNAPLYRSINNSFDTLHIIPLGKELATYTGRLSSTMTDTSGKTMIFSMVETGVLIRRQNGWKLLHGQTTLLDQ